MAALLTRTTATSAWSRWVAVLVAVVVGLLALAPGEAAGAEPRIRIEPILTGYERPLLVTHDGSASRTIFIVEQTGTIRRATFRDGTWRKRSTPFLDLRSIVNDPVPGQDERGLLGLAFDPGHARNGRLYVAYTSKPGRQDNGDLVVARYRRTSSRSADPSSGRPLLVVDQPLPNHNGGHLAFGPDGHLYAGLGDGGGAGDPGNNAQDPDSLLGKLLRISPRDPDGAGPLRYAIPADNPYVDAPGHDEIWSSGLRHPWRYSFDRKTGDLWIGDVGQASREEVDRSPADATGRNAGRGLDYGWDKCEGKLRFPDDGGPASGPCSHGTLPLYDYAHGNGRCSVTGGYVYRGPDARAWRGLYIAGDYCGRIFALDRKGRVVFSKVTPRLITSFGEDAAGRLFLTDLRGGVYRLRLEGTPPKP
jgi:hypothetical protein